MKFKLFLETQRVLRESAKHGRTWKVVLIEEGLSKNGKYYPADVLQKAAKLFNGAKAFFYEFKKGDYNHLPPAISSKRPEGFPHQIAGWYKNAKFETIDVEGQEKRAITADLHIHEGAEWLREMLKDAWMNGMKKLLGLSIDAEGSTGTKVVNNKQIEVVTEISKVFGVDLVTHPAAGGQLIRLMASKFTEGGTMNREKMIEMIKKMRPELLEGVNLDETNDEALMLIVEAAMKAKEADDEGDDETMKCPACGKDIPKGSTKCPECGAEIKQETDEEKETREADEDKVKKEKEEKDKKDKEEKEAKEKKEKEEKEAKAKEALDLKTRIDNMEDKAAIEECAKILNAKLTASRLPDIVKTKIEKRFAGKKVQESEIVEAIKEEVATLSALAEAGEVDLEDFSRITVGKEKVNRLQAAANMMLNGGEAYEDDKDDYEGIDSFSSLREMYVKITGDTDISGVIPKNRLQEATTSDFSYILGTSIYRKMAKEYKFAPEYWKNLCDVVSLKDFKTQEVIRWGGFANLETVSETDTITSDSYSDIAFPGDEEATYAAATKGGIVKITRKMIINDDLRVLTKLPKKLAKAAGNTLNQFVFDLMLNYSAPTINGGTIYDSLALYHANHLNYTTDALDYDSYGDAIDRLSEQKELGFSLTGDTTVSAAEINDISFASGGTGFKVGDYLKCEAEYIGPLSVVAATYVRVASTAGRGIWGTTAAVHASAVWTVVSNELALEPEFLWVPTPLRNMGDSILLNEYQDDTLSNRNPYKGSAKLMAIPRSYLRGDANNWFVTAKKSDVELIELGFLGGKQVPEILRQDAPGVGAVFTNDVIRYKVRHEYGGAVIDYRGFQGAVVA